MNAVVMKLSGNLGERHRCFNALVHEARQQNTPLPAKNNSEEPALDRLFKIDLASKQRNVDFIINTLKDGDLLYVTRALKSLWLLEPEYSGIINPTFLEDELFPDMTLPAVKKMRHWIQMHLRDPLRCEEFHQFYKTKDVDIAVKFLWHCSNEYVLGEISVVLEKITPKLLKRLSERAPQITKIYYDNLRHNEFNESLIEYYLANDGKFFANTRHLLKTDAYIFFHVLENFFDPWKFDSLSAAMTKIIMRDHKNRFMRKPELYTAYFLDMATLARCLSSEEIKDLLLKLARAEYLNTWFSYQNVQPLIGCLSEDDRIVFGKMVFVEKAFGPTVKEWPYPIPVPPVLKAPQKHVFDDIEVGINYNKFDSRYKNEDGFMKPRRAIIKKNNSATFLDELFDKYRFNTYEQTFAEFRKLLRAESTAQNRMYMLLVLVSKTRGRTDLIASLLDLLLQHRNEPVHIRAAIMRSLVKQACIWRLPPEHWARLLIWGHDLGLDGSNPQANCSEGFHAVVIRELLADGKPSEAIWKTFLSTYFNSLREYSFTSDERRCVKDRLPALLLASIQSEPDDSRLILVHRLLDTLKAYHVRFNDFSGVVEAVTATVKYNWNTSPKDAESLLRRLYDAGVSRQLLIREYFEIIQTEASYVNALRHDISSLDSTDKFEKLIEKKYVKHDKFFRKLALYFTENNGLGEQYLAVLKRSAVSDVTLSWFRGKPFSEIEHWPGLIKGRQILALPLAILSGLNFSSLLKTFDAAPPKTPQRQLAAALRSNAHVVRPAFDLDAFGWRQAGAKAVANRVATCRQRDVERYLQECLTWRRTLRLALIQAKRVNKEYDVFKVFVSERSGTALRVALLRYICRERDSCDPRIWEILKSDIAKSYCYDRFEFYKKFIERVPAAIKAKYFCLLYAASIDLFSPRQSLDDRVEVLVCEVPSEIPAVILSSDEQYIYNVIDGVIPISNEFNEGTDSFWKILFQQYIYCYCEIIAKFLILCTSEEMLEDRHKRVALPFLNGLELEWKLNRYSMEPQKILDRFLFYLRYNKVYFNDTYVSCLPVLEKIKAWMHSFLPQDKWFEKYVYVDLTMIYFKTVRHCLKQNPGLLSEFNDLEISYMLGTTFGKFVSNEIDGLTQKYFPSILNLYGSVFLKYIYGYFYHLSEDSYQKFIMAVVKGLVTNNSAASSKLAIYMFMECRIRLKNEYVDDILETLKESGIHDFQTEFCVLNL